MSAPPHNLEAERCTLGAVLLAPKPVMKALLGAGLRAEHFYRERYGRIFSVMEILEGRGEGIDFQTVRFEIERSANGDAEELIKALDDCSAAVPAAGNVRRYADRVIELAEWRRRRTAAEEILAATAGEDLDRFRAAGELLSDAPLARARDTYMPERWADVISDHFFRPEPPRAIPLPLPRLTGALYGGLWPGEVMLVAGHTNHGKSVWGDQILDTAAEAGFRVHAYLTEMSALTRGLRLISRKTGIPFGKLRQRSLDERQMEQILGALKSLPYGVTIASSWDIEDVARDALHARWDLILVDLIHGFRYEDERGLDRLSKTLQRLAITSTTLEGFEGTSVVAVAHLNRGGGGVAGKRGRPRLSDLKGGSALEQDVDIVNFVWLEDDEKGVPTSTGEIWFAKGRSVMHDSVAVELNPIRFRFEPAA